MTEQENEKTIDEMKKYRYAFLKSIIAEITEVIENGGDFILSLVVGGSNTIIGYNDANTPKVLREMNYLHAKAQKQGISKAGDLSAFLDKEMSGKEKTIVHNKTMGTKPLNKSESKGSFIKTTKKEDGSIELKFS